MTMSAVAASSSSSVHGSFLGGGMYRASVLEPSSRDLLSVCTVRLNRLKWETISFVALMASSRFNNVNVASST